MEFKTQQVGHVTSIAAAADLAYVHRFVGTDGNYAGAGVNPLGVLQMPVKSGEMVGVAIDGILLVTASGAISVGADVACAANGKVAALAALTATPPTGAVAVLSSGAQAAMTIAGGALPSKKVGFALDEATTDGDVIRIVIR